MLKPGYLTTEFWLTVATDVALLASALADVLPPRYAAIAAAVANAAYAVARGWAKNGNGGQPVKATLNVQATQPPPGGVSG